MFILMIKKRINFKKNNLLIRYMNYYPLIYEQIPKTLIKDVKMNPFQAENTFGNYFQTCNNPSSYWGSANGPVEDKCLTPQKGQPCHNIWNNNTSRKMIVDYKR